MSEIFHEMNAKQNEQKIIKITIMSVYIQENHRCCRRLSRDRFHILSRLTLKTEHRAEVNDTFIGEKRVRRAAAAVSRTHGSSILNTY